VTVAVALDGRPFAVMSFTVIRGKIVEIDILADPAPPPARSGRP